MNGVMPESVRSWLGYKCLHCRGGYMIQGFRAYDRLEGVHVDLRDWDDLAGADGVGVVNTDDWLRFRDKNGTGSRTDVMEFRRDQHGFA